MMRFQTCVPWLGVVIQHDDGGYALGLWEGAPGPFRTIAEAIDVAAAKFFTQTKTAAPGKAERSPLARARPPPISAFLCSCIKITATENLFLFHPIFRQLMFVHC
jgi:hypothetical protein